MKKTHSIFPLTALLLCTLGQTQSADNPMRTEEIPAFYVIGKLGQGTAQDKEKWIPPLWAALNEGGAEIFPHILKNAAGSPQGIWAIMSDLDETFAPWDDRGGKYLAGFETDASTLPPSGWTKWRVPGYRYLIVETAINAYGETFDTVMHTYLPEHGLTLAGAVHERYPDPENPGIIELLFPIEQLPETGLFAKNPPARPT